VGYIAGKVEAWAASKLLSNVSKGEKYIEGTLPWREAGPPNHQDDKVDSDQ